MARLQEEVDGAMRSGTRLAGSRALSTKTFSSILGIRDHTQATLNFVSGFQAAGDEQIQLGVCAKLSLTSKPLHMAVLHSETPPGGNQNLFVPTYGPSQIDFGSHLVVFRGASRVIQTCVAGQGVKMLCSVTLVVSSGLQQCASTGSQSALE